MSRWALLAVLAAGCGDNLPGPPDPGSLVFTPCGSGSFECAKLVVPADYAQPDGATLTLPVYRAPARDPEHRIGALTFNFGGPGEGTALALLREYPLQPFASSQDMTQRFDWVLMDWRGVATSDPALACLSADTASRLSAQTFAPATDEQWAALFQLGTDVAAGCVANPANAPLLLHQDSESAARDLDALRAGLGEAQLNYWGVSYGTRLGEMYASLFPERARAIVIDSPLAAAPTFEDDLQGQSASFEHEITRFEAWCAAATTAVCPFRTADGAATSVTQRLEELLAAADATPVVAHAIVLDRPTIQLAVTVMMYFPPTDWPRLGTALADLAQGDGDSLAMLYASNAIDSANDDNSFTSYQNVTYQDIPPSPDLATPAGYRAWAETQIAIAPHVGLQNAAAQAFAVAWPATVPHEHVIGAATAPPLLITATRNDPATPYAGARSLQQTLANGSYLVTYEGDGHAQAQFQRCLGDATTAFLLDPSTAPTVTDCPEVVVGSTAAAAAAVVHIARGHRTRHP